MLFILAIVFFVLGIIIGSFLSVVICRYNTNKNLGGRSACMSCQTTLHWYELIPLASFFFLRGRCRTCRTKISMQDPLVELFSGLIFVALFFKLKTVFFIDSFSFVLSYGYYAAMFSLLLIVSFYDIKHKIIPDVMSLTLGIGAFIGMFFFSGGTFYPHVPSLSHFLAGFVISIPFALFWLVSKGRWMGLGDAKLSVGLGFLLGMEAVLSGTVLAFWIGSLAGISLLLSKKIKSTKSEIPFAPFLVLGAMIAFFFGINLFPVF